MTVDPTIVIAAISALASAVGWGVRRVYTDLVRDRDYWRTLALRGTDLADNATTVALRKRGDV